MTATLPEVNCIIPEMRTTVELVGLELDPSNWAATAALMVRTHDENTPEQLANIIRTERLASKVGVLGEGMEIVLPVDGENTCGDAIEALLGFLKELPNAVKRYFVVNDVQPVPAA